MDFSPEQQLKLLDIMEHFDLVCPASSDGWTRDTSSIASTDLPMPTQSQVHTNYYVPSLFPPGNVKNESDLASCGSVIFFVDFNGLFTSKESHTFDHKCLNTTHTYYLKVMLYG